MDMDTATKPIGCLQAATDILGDKWTPHLLRYFINEETVRFCQLQDLTGGINPRTLSSRLTNLEETGIIKKIISGPGSRCEYQLTSKGHDLLPILLDMEAWSEKYAPSVI
jgi:DNA-binding HxlR family transcriptional regulator